MFAMVFGLRRRESRTRCSQDGGIHSTLSRVRSGVRSVPDLTVGELSVRISAVRRLRSHLRSLCGRVQQISRHGNHAQMCRSVPPLREDLLGGRQVRPCSTSCIGTIQADAIAVANAIFVDLEKANGRRTLVLAP